MHQGFQFDPLLCLPLSLVMLEVVEYLPVPMGFCLLYPSPNHSITIGTQVLFLTVSIGLPLNLPQFMSYFWVWWVSQALTLSSYPWLILLRLRSKPDVGEKLMTFKGLTKHIAQSSPRHLLLKIWQFSFLNALHLPLITEPKHLPGTGEVILVSHHDTCNTWLASRAYCHLGFP